ncbi:MAG: helix-turn-helix domain-containing protein [Lautropia sp.]
MQIDTELSPLLLAIYRGARELPRVAFEEFALGRIKPLLGFDSALWAQGRSDGSHADVSWAHQHEIDPDALQVWLDINKGDKVIPTAVGNKHRTVRAHAPTLFAAPDDADCRAYATRFGCEQLMVMVVPNGEADPDAARWLSLYRASPDTLYTDRERAICNVLMPHLMEALTINRLATLDAPTAAPPRQPASTPLAVAEPDGRIRFAQAAFLRRLQSEWSQADQTRLPQPLLAAITGRTEAVVLGRITRARISRRADMLLVEMRALSPIDRLPPRRARVAWLYAQGHTHKQVARELGIAPSTVRNQIATAYRELGIVSRAQLRTLASD